MERTLKWLSPKSSSGSILTSVVVHVLVYGSMIVVLGLNLNKKEEPIQASTDVTYEVLDEPPVENPPEQKLVSTPPPETPEEVDEKPDNSRKELQDEKGEVAGTQTAPAAKVVQSTGATSAGTAVATPFYKIKPKYPKEALLAGTEGWVLFKIDVKETGEVENLRVIDGIQRSLFQDEARKALQKWKYRPFVDESGKAVPKRDLQVRVDFHVNEVSSG